MKNFSVERMNKKIEASQPDTHIKELRKLSRFIDVPDPLTYPSVLKSEPDEVFMEEPEKLTKRIILMKP